MKYVLIALLALFSLSASAASNVLNWDFPVAEETKTTEFSVEGKPVACAAAGTFAEIGTVAKNLRSFTHANVAEGSTWCYQIRAEGPGGFSPYSNVVARTIPFTAPVAPSNLRVTGGI